MGRSDKHSWLHHGITLSRGVVHTWLLLAVTAASGIIIGACGLTAGPNAIAARTPEPAVDPTAQAAAQPPADFKVIVDQPVGKLLNRSDLLGAEKTRVTPDGKFIYSGSADHPGKNALPLPHMWVLPQITHTSDIAFYMSLQVRQLKGPPTLFYGLGFHYTNRSPTVFGKTLSDYSGVIPDVPDRYYFFETNDAHELSAGTTWFTQVNPQKIDRTDGAHTKASEVNQLVVRGNGTTYSFFINGYHEADFEDPLLQGGWAVLVLPLWPEDTYEFEFGQFVLASQD